MVPPSTPALAAYLKHRGEEIERECPVQQPGLIQSLRPLLLRLRPTRVEWARRRAMEKLAIT
jgi:hypothetical protein